jgi:Iguana/Dzip1-like DAZ-interacting protein N-terminal
MVKQCSRAEVNLLGMVALVFYATCITENINSTFLPDIAFGAVNDDSGLDAASVHMKAFSMAQLSVQYLLHCEAVLKVSSKQSLFIHCYKRTTLYHSL